MGFRLPARFWSPGAYGWYALGIVAAFTIWELAALWLGQYRLPSFSLIGPKFFSLLTESKSLSFQGGGDRGYWPHLAHTIMYTIGASALGVATGVSFALVIGRFRIVRAISEVPLELLRTIPPLAAIPFILIWIGPGNPAQLIMVWYYVFMMMAFTTLNAASNVNPILPKFAATLGANRNRIFRTVVFPAMVPTIIGGLRVAVGVAWGVQIVAELMGGRLGMGRVFSTMISFQALDAIIVGIIWISFAAAIVDLALVLLMRRITRWAPTIE